MVEHGYILAAFPENYRLYEHVKKTEKDGKTEVKSKTHAGGGNDRQDAYLYGHPQGRRKRFRSPADFFPHLLWLCVDEGGDPDNCGCKICSPEDLEAAIPGARIKNGRTPKQEADVKPTFKPPITQAGAGIVRQPSAQGMSVRTKQESNTPSAKPASAPKQPTPTPLPQRTTNDQRIDSQYRTFMYRPGELVWFRRTNAWGLGVVLRRWITKPDQYNYTVQPLSWPHYHPKAVTLSSDAEMRPWLAWSVPRFTNDALNNMLEPPRYETADWQGMSQKRYGTGDMEVDGSILAAKAIDATYTPFGPTRTLEPEPGVTETHYAGLYLGAEKVWTGDPLRLHTGSTGTDIMVLHAIIERKRTSALSSHQQQVPQHSCHLLGDVYTLVTVSHSDPSLPSPAAASNNPHLPQRLTEDLAARNALSIRAKRQASYWKLLTAQRKLELNEIKGRWYEASLLLPILQSGTYEELARKGEVAEASLWMNSRGDCVNSNRPAHLPKVPKINVRKETRREALGRAVPPEARVVDGVDPPENNVDPALGGDVGAVGLGASAGDVMELDPRFETADAQAARRGQHGTHHGAQQPATESVGGGLDEFMNLDDIEDHSQLPGFGQEYGSQSQGGYY